MTNAMTAQRSGTEPRTTARTRSNGLRAQGLRTRNTIVRVARKLLFEEGALEFSQRAIATRARISVSNLQYYFPTKQAVLRAVMAPAVEACLDDVKHAFDGNTSSREALDAFLERRLREAKDAENTTLWLHFLTFSSTDPECAQLLEEWYGTLTRELARLIRVANPKCELTDSLQAAVLHISMVDGLTLYLAATRGKRAYVQGVESRIIETSHYLARGMSVDDSVGKTRSGDPLGQDCALL
ncbi:TetR/AcrR family transcriptional regulator [Ralstonia flatus]|uniref:HTH tetR-type domain-containing protein n=1 Tax=Ralstonia flatus TaxID=3058601 RepID=A0ABM9L0L5_9RALS|nr:TetR/AcrR family transcriptional regulator [Ralstonia sp. LMG 32965]CAJ0895571.1 hypothetical protein R77564_03903 [Ralstonia sp. LMG 32965]